MRRPERSHDFLACVTLCSDANFTDSPSFLFVQLVLDFFSGLFLLYCVTTVYMHTPLSFFV